MDYLLEIKKDTLNIIHTITVYHLGTIPAGPYSVW